MKQLLIGLVCLLSGLVGGVQAQDRTLPQRFSFQLGAGLGLPCVDGNKNDFFHQNGNRAGYFILAEARRYFTPNLGLGFQYDYFRSAKLPDKAHVHYVHPNLVLRLPFAEARKSVCFGLGIGYLGYEERTSSLHARSKNVYRHGYCGLSFSLGYEFSISRSFPVACVRIFSLPIGLSIRMLASGILIRRAMTTA